MKRRHKWVELVRHYFPGSNIDFDEHLKQNLFDQSYRYIIAANFTNFSTNFSFVIDLLPLYLMKKLETSSQTVEIMSSPGCMLNDKITSFRSGLCQSNA